MYGVKQKSSGGFPDFANKNVCHMVHGYTKIIHHLSIIHIELASCDLCGNPVVDLNEIQNRDK